MADRKKDQDRQRQQGGGSDDNRQQSQQGDTDRQRQQGGQGQADRQQGSINRDRQMGGGDR